MELTILDGGLIVAAIVGAALGSSAGGFLALAYIAAGMAGSAAAAYYAPELGTYLAGYTSVAYWIVLAGVACAFSAVAFLLNRFTAMPLVNFVNRLAGLVLGAAIGMAVVAANVFPYLAQHRPGFKAMVDKSRLAPRANQLTDKILNEWPADLQKRS
jgi:predicted membrane protein